MKTPATLPWKRHHHQIFDGENRKIAEVVYHPEAYATQQLMLSAPEMFDALQAVCDAYGDRDTLLMAQCKAALAKAKG
jgi:hypothetical protein